LKQFIEDQKTGEQETMAKIFNGMNLRTEALTGEPWLKVNENHSSINATAQEKDPNSVLNYFRKMVKLRKDNHVLVYGKYTLIDAKTLISMLTRELDGKKLLMLNFRSEKAKLDTKINLKNSTDRGITQHLLKV
jgi:oligo-1,6-glucosidase